MRRGGGGDGRWGGEEVGKGGGGMDRDGVEVMVWNLLENKLLFLMPKSLLFAPFITCLWW